MKIHLHLAAVLDLFHQELVLRMPVIRLACYVAASKNLSNVIEIQCFKNLQLLFRGYNQCATDDIQWIIYASYSWNMHLETTGKRGFIWSGHLNPESRGLHKTMMQPLKPWNMHFMLSKMWCWNLQLLLHGFTNMEWHTIGWSTLFMKSTS